MQNENYFVVMTDALLLMAANATADDLSESTFGRLAEFCVVSGFASDDEAPAAIAGVEPFRGRNLGPSGAVEMNASPQLDERRSLWKLGGILVIDTHQGDSQIFLQNAHRTNGDCVSVFCLADGLPC